MSDVPQTSFWFFQAKDIVSPLVAIASLVVSFTTLRISYLRKANVRVQLGETIDFTMNDQEQIHAVSDTLVLNSGAEAALIFEMYIVLNKILNSGEHHVFRYRWREFRSVVEKRNDSVSGFAFSGRRFEFSGYANSLLVPKNDARTQIINFAPFRSRGIDQGYYEMYLEGSLLNSQRGLFTRRHRRFHSNKRIVEITEKHFVAMQKMKSKVVDGLAQDSGHLRFYRIDDHYYTYEDINSIDPSR